MQYLTKVFTLILATVLFDITHCQGNNKGSPDTKPSIPASGSPVTKPSTTASGSPDTKPSIPASGSPVTKPSTTASGSPDTKPSIPASGSPVTKPSTPAPGGGSERFSSNLVTIVMPLFMLLLMMVKYSEFY